MQESVQHSEFADVKPFTNGTTGTLPDKTAGHPASAENTATEVHRPATGATSVEMDTAVFIKREPDTVDYLSSASPCGDGQDMVTGAADFAAIKSDSEGHKRRLSFSLKADPSKWGSLCTLERDTRDDLKLTAYDVIAGVISTPPIKPLEPEGENGTSKLKPLASLTTGTAPPSTTATTILQPTSQATSPVTTPTTSTTSCCTSLPKVTKEQHYLVHELDEFSKIMDAVTQEQTAMELAAAETVYSEPSHEPSLVSPYLSISPSCPPREISVPNNSFYQQKYPQVQAAQKQSQVVHQDYHHHQHHQHHHHQQQQQHSASMPAECKSPLLLSGVSGRLSVLSDLPSSSSSQPVPPTPTTPLEHFSSSSQLVPPTTPLEHFTSFSSPSHSYLTTSSAARAGTSHLSTHPGIPHLPSHPSTSHLPSHPSTSHLPSHPSTSHLPLHPSTSHLPSHPSNSHHPLHPVNLHAPPHPGATPHISPHSGTTPHITPHPGTTPRISPHQCSPQQVVCQPYPSTPPHPFPYNHPPDTNSYLSSGSASVGDSWSSTHRHQPPQVIGVCQGRAPITSAHRQQPPQVIGVCQGRAPITSSHRQQPPQVIGVCEGQAPITSPHQQQSPQVIGVCQGRAPITSAHRQQPPQVIGVCQGRAPITSASISQGSLKDSILARVSSRVVAIAGQKRPPMLDLSGVPSSKRKGGGSMLDHCGRSAGGGPPPQYSSVTHHTPSPYETSTTPLSLSSVSFPSPHQHL